MRIARRLGSVARDALSPRAAKRLRRGAARLVMRLRWPRWWRLETLASLNGAEKEKRFIELYAGFFAPYRSRKIHLLEIGIGGAGNPHKGGGSLRTWSRYFSRGKIFGVDLHDKKAHDVRGRITTFRGDQSDVPFLRRVASEIGRLDIVIDDGSHRNEDVIRTLETLFPLLADDGVYVIEDVQTSYWGSYGGGSHDLDAPATSMGMLKRLADGLNYQEFELESYQPNDFDQQVVGVFFAHNIVFIFKGDNTSGSNILGKRW